MLALIAIFSCISSFLFGYDLGLVGGALLHIQAEMGVSDMGASIIVGAAKLGATLGTFLGGALMLYYGRRPTIAMNSVFFMVGPLVMAASWNATGLVVGRTVVGLGIGISAVVVPSYLGEVAPARSRGRIVELYELMLCFGMLAASLMDAALENVPGNWRLMVGIPVLPSILMTMAICVLPESPRWLVTHGRLDEALAVIHRVNTSSILPVGAQSSTAEVEADLMELWSAVEKDKAEAAERRKRHASGRLRHRRHLQQEPGEGLAAGGGGSGQPLQRAPSPRQDVEAAGADGNSSGRWNGAGGERAIVSIPPQLPRIRTRSMEALHLLDPPPQSGDNASSGRHVGPQPQPSRPGHGSAGAGAGSAGVSPGPAALEHPASSALKDGFWSTAWDMMQDIFIVARGPERGALRMALILAFFNQAFASTAIINYAPSVLHHAGVQSGAAAELFTSLIGASKLVGVAIAFFLVDTVGRRPLLLCGSAGCALSLALLVPADWADSHWMLLAGMCAFIFSFSMSWAGILWVLLSEIFSMGAKSPAASAATATLFLTGAAADLAFLGVRSALGPWAFLLYSLIALAAAAYVWAYVPETKGRTLREVQDLLSVKARQPAVAEGEGEQEGLVPPRSMRSVELQVPSAGSWR